MNINLSDKIAVVTGATGELGRVMARTLTQCGARVAIHYLQAADKAAALQKELPGSCVVQADVTQRADIERMRDEIIRQLGAPDIIVNNAVIQYQWTTVLKQSPDDYRSQFESCVLHNVLMAQAFVPAMIAKKWGRVIALNTECAMQNWPSQSAYVSGKRGMDGVLRVLAKEVGEHGITVNQVAPGWTVSETRPASMVSSCTLMLMRFNAAHWAGNSPTWHPCTPLRSTRQGTSTQAVPGRLVRKPRLRMFPPMRVSVALFHQWEEAGNGTPTVSSPARHPKC